MPENRFDIDQHDPERSGSEKAEAERSRFGHEKVRIPTSSFRSSRSDGHEEFRINQWLRNSGRGK